MPSANPVVMTTCNILSMTIATGQPIPEGESVDMHSNAEFQLLTRDVDGAAIGMEAVLHVGNDRGCYFSDIEVRARALFGFPEEMSEEECLEYLGHEAPARIIDTIRMQLRQITAVFEYGPILIPSLPAVVKIDKKSI